MEETEEQRHFNYIVNWILALCGILALAGIYYQQNTGNNWWLLLGLPLTLISLLFLHVIWMFRGVEI